MSPPSRLAVRTPGGSSPTSLFLLPNGMGPFNDVSNIVSTPAEPDPCLPGFFGWAAQQGRYRHRIECYASLIELLLLSGDVDGVTSVFAELRNLGFLLTVPAANSLIKSLGSVGMVEELVVGVEEDEGEWYRAEFVHLQLLAVWFGGFGVYGVDGAGV
ncbi:hypothetical protein NL676_017508 [Syzygium grande]|nr:hypothetical protein NL676_017508 [Syzygium grande]